MGARHRFVSNAVNPLIPVKIGLLTFLALSGSLLGFSAASIAGPKDNFGDPCLYRYAEPENTWSYECLTKKGRVLNKNGQLQGYLGRDHVDSIPSKYMSFGNGKGITLPGGTYSIRYEQAGKDNEMLVSYSCSSDFNGTCTGKTTKKIKYYIP